MVKPKTKVETEYAFITPQMAEKLLERNTRNRKLTESLVHQYARAMTEGGWREAGDAVRIDKNGDLLDGQHRLWACIFSDVGFWANVVTGLEPESQEVMDSGRSRTAGDVGSMRGYKYANTRASLAKTVLSLHGSNLFTKPEIWEFHDSIQEAINFVINNFHYPIKKSITQTSVGAAIVRAWFYYDDKDRLLRFCEVLRSGMAVNEDEHTAVRLREFLKDGEGKGVRRNRRELYLKTQASIRAFMAKRNIRTVQMPRGDLFPLPHVDPATGIKNGLTDNSVHHYRAKYLQKDLPKTRGDLVKEIHAKVRNIPKRYE